MHTPSRLQTSEPTFAELFTPKTITVLREGYGLNALRSDLMAGLTVAIVALPLSMAIAIASGATPAQGLYTAIVGGFLVSLLGGSRFQIGGPAGAFIVLVAATIAQHGIDGMLLATLMSGFMLIAAGLLRLGTFIKFIPFPVTVGFTAGIAVIIFTSQLKDLLGLTLQTDPASVPAKLIAAWQALPSATPAAIALSLGTVTVIVALKHLRPNWPGLLIAVTTAAAATALTGLDVATIGSRFGGIPDGLPAPAIPPFSLDRIISVMPAAVSFTLLGSIESLLSAVIADGMTGRRHRSNCELTAQGFANIGSALFGGICVTGTIARTATNVRARAHGPMAGMFHALFLLLFMLFAAPLASYIPLAALAGVLAVVAWNMIEKPAIAVLVRSGWGEAAVLAVTFLLTVFRDLTEAIVAGFALGSVLFIHRMSEATALEPDRPLVRQDVADVTEVENKAVETATPDDDQVVYRLTGAFFFGAAASLGALLDTIAESPRTLVIDLSAVPFLDSTGANVLERLAHKTRRRGASFWITGANANISQVLHRHGLVQPLCRYAQTPAEALRM